MIHSMTGYASAELEHAGMRIFWELRTVNHRYLELTYKLPERFRYLEPALRNRTAERIKRGKLDAMLTVKPASSESGALELDLDLLKKLLTASEVVESYMPQPAPFSAWELLRWPGLLEPRQVAADELESAVVTGLDQTLCDLAETRRREGAQLTTTIQARLLQLRTLVANTRSRVPYLRAALRERLLLRLQELEVDYDANRLEQELLYFAQKADVAEEMDRLAAHLEEMGRILQQQDPVGRRIDFLLQEMNREANTLGSKSQDLTTTQSSIEMKVLIEQIREQAQNIE